MARVPSNFRCDMTLQDFLEKYETPGIEGIDTRKLVRILREKGTMNGYITTNENVTYESVKDKLKAYTTGDVVSKVSCKEKQVILGTMDIAENGPLSGAASFDQEAFNEALKGDLSKREKRPSNVRELNGFGFKVALLDVGAKKNIAASLAARGCDVTIYPYNTSAEEILADEPDGIMLSNGPGDPKECTEVIKEIKKLYESDTPIFAICLGHQLMALATGADTYKLHYGHRGGNHPVKDLENGRVYISSQNHGYAVNVESLDKNVAVPAFENVNDGTNEGLKYVGKNIFTVQFHPEACPGPQDSSYLFDRFINMMNEGKEREVRTDAKE
jgi:carbamoyl-phosphate synthase small subunit